MFSKALRLYQNQEISASRMGVIAFLSLGHYFHGVSFAQSRELRIDLEEILAIDSLDLAERLERTRFKCIKSKVSRALAQWVLGHWQLELLFHVPSVSEVLSLQASSRRCVTLYPDQESWEGPKLTKENALHFFVHDLEHAVQFFDHFHDQQVRLNQKLLKLYNDGYFRDIQARELKERVDYLLSDMNTHPEHSYQFLQAIWIDHYKGESEIDSSSMSVESFVTHKMSQIDLELTCKI